ncbi:hypothetical protein BD311DRAFT_685214 [Dichomitus squalens]|uniref:Uncharacterized protein n=1 Tax=Dichomitus squalens TaxID=114155 RepID=A0A4Q9N2Q8_9APHY|nr:hypothetical protein BD311DRAFT_685214 [Dichomitus squalens]
MSNLSSSSSITPTPSTFHNTPTATHPNSVYTVRSGSGPASPPHAGLPPPSPNRSRIPVTPAVLRSIFASSRTALEERSLSRVAFFRFTGFLLSCLCISFSAARGRGIKSGAALLGVGVV